MKSPCALLLALGTLALAACGSSGSGRNDVTGAAGTGSGSAGTSGSAGAGGGPACQVNILPVLPASFDGLVAGPTAKVRVSGQITGTVSPLFDWQWTVTLADGAPVPVTLVSHDPASLVEFPMASIGTYTIAVALTGTSCAGLRTITAAEPGAKTAAFRIHVTPPSTALVPAQDIERQVVGGTPSAGNTLTLSPGFMVGVGVARADTGEALPSYVRLTDVASGAVIEARTRAGPTMMRIAQGMYTTLIVPDGDVAPVTLPARSAAEIGAGVMALDDGATIGGTVVDANGAGVKGATVVLRSDDLVSTTGTTDATGAFHVRARSGTFGVTVVSPLAAGGLESKLAATGGLVVDSTKAAPPLAIRMGPSSLVTANVTLTAGDTRSVTAATRVSLTATGLAGVGTLAVGTGAAQALAGDVRFSLHPAADGTVTTGPVPPGQYQLTVFPADAASSDGVTTTTLDLSAGNLGPIGVALAPKVMLSGKLQPADEGVQIIAQDDGGLPIVSQGPVGMDGSFAFLVSPVRHYLLRALPGADQPLARASFPEADVTSAPFVVQGQRMPTALLYAGRVVDPNLQGVGTALVQVFCETKTPTCTDLTVPVAETVTRSDGTFRLMLPDPDGTP